MHNKCFFLLLSLTLLDTVIENTIFRWIHPPLSRVKPWSHPEGEKRVQLKTAYTLTMQMITFGKLSLINSCIHIYICI